jgi:hypothetical protein
MLKSQIVGVESGLFSVSNTDAIDCANLGTSRFQGIEIGNHLLLVGDGHRKALQARLSIQELWKFCYAFDGVKFKLASLNSFANKLFRKVLFGKRMSQGVSN